MDHEEVGRYWDENAETWTRLVRAGYDVARDGLNTPAFFEILPEVDGLSGIDVGCGEGHNTRLVAERGARMVGVDISETFVRHAKAAEEAAPLGVRYRRASAAELPFADESFDFAVAFMSLMDMPELGRVLAEVFRVLRPGGFLQVSIEHPCFTTPPRRTLRDEYGRAYAREVGDYFREEKGGGAGVGLQLRSARGAGGASALPRPPLHPHPEHVAEPADRGRVRDRTVRRAVPGRRGHPGVPGLQAPGSSPTSSTSGSANRRPRYLRGLPDPLAL
jgi:SAM-dependent methyltransferase